MKKFFISITIIISLLSCTTKKEEIKFTFLQLNDVYEIAPLAGGKIGGMARVATIHQQLKKENPNTFLFLAGDFLNPSLLGTIKYKGQRIKGKQMIEVMNAMNFDLVAFGNHEFDLKEEELQQRLNESNFTWIGTNVKHKKTDAIVPFSIQKKGGSEKIKKTHTFEIKNKFGKAVKIGFFSACINSNPKSYVNYADFYETAKQSYNALKSKTDIVFGLTHLAKEQDKMIAQMLPKVPLIMGGHEHINMKIPVGNTYITKADANAKTVYIHRVTYNTKTKKVIINSELKEINETVKEDTKVAKIVNKWNLLLDDKIKQITPDANAIIFYAKEPLDGRDTPIRSIQTNLGNIITKAMAHSFNNKVDGAIVNGGSIRIDDQLQGDITGIDIFRVLPYGGEVKKIELRGNLLLKTLNYGRLKAGKGAYLQRHNIEYDKKTKTWLIKGKQINPKKIYTIAVSDYLLKGLDIPILKIGNKDLLKVYKNNETDLSYDIRKAVINYLKTLKTKNSKFF